MRAQSLMGRPLGCVLVYEIAGDVCALMGDCPFPYRAIEMLEQQGIKDRAPLPYVGKGEVVLQPVTPLQGWPLGVAHHQPQPAGRQAGVLAFNNILYSGDLSLADPLINPGGALELIILFRLAG